MKEEGIRNNIVKVLTGKAITDDVEASGTIDNDKYDLEGMTVGTVVAGRIGLAVLKRMQAFDCELHYADRHRLPKEVEDITFITMPIGRIW